MFWFNQAPLPKVTFATSCWEKDWKEILLHPDYLAKKQIAHHLFPFQEKLLIINNVSDLPAVERAAQQKIEEGVLTRYVVSEKIADEVLKFFALKRTDFRTGPDAHLYSNVNDSWIYYNALGPLAAIYAAKGDYLLYLTGDVRLDEPIDWIGKAVRLMEKNPAFKVANLTWNHRTDEAKKESDFRKRGFYISSCGFSDQMFLVPLKDFRAPIYGEIREDASQFPRGDVFEKRAFSAMKNRSWLRMTYSNGSYTHENF